MASEGMDEGKRLRSEPVWLMINLVLLGIVVLFAGLTAAYLFSPSPDSINGFRFPRIFWLSSIIVIIVSFSMRRMLQAYSADNGSLLRRWLLTATFLSLAFVVCQWSGWTSLHRQGIGLEQGPAAAYLYVISGLHVLHVAIGIAMLIFSLVRSGKWLHNPATALVYFSDPIRKRRLELLARYWYTIDHLWLFLFLVFLYKHV